MKTYLLFILSLLAIIGLPITFNGQTVWINEFHYENSGNDTIEFIELVVDTLSTTNLENIHITLVNGNDNASYGEISFADFIRTDTIDSFLFLVAEVGSIQNGSPDGIALLYNDKITEFISYEGAFTTSTWGLSTDIMVEESASTPVGYSLQRIGRGDNYPDFSWDTPRKNTKGTLNENQILSRLPYIQFVESKIYLSETDETKNITIEITIENIGQQDVSFSLEIIPRSSSASQDDFNGLSLILNKELNFPSTGNDRDTITVSIRPNDDSIYEGEEILLLRLAGDGFVTENPLSIILSDNENPTIVINEIFFNPPLANSILDPIDDEFIEIANSENNNINISGWTIENKRGTQYTFTDEAVISHNGAIVVFGYSSSESQESPAHIENTNTIALAGSGLSLNNEGDDIKLKNSLGVVIDSVSYSSNPSGASWTRAPRYYWWIYDTQYRRK